MQSHQLRQNKDLFLGSGVTSTFSANPHAPPAFSFLAAAADFVHRCQL